MRKSLALLKRFAREENGASMIEYGVLVGLITAAAIVTIGTIGDNIQARFAAVLTSLTTGDGVQ
jgi:pilus assembly protein Flp/PilA